MDMNEITMNLVPYPRMHFLLSSISPIHSIKKTKFVSRNLDQIFMESIAPENQLIDCDPRKGVTTAMGFLLRGDISFSDVSRNIEKVSKKVNMIDWNSEGYKYGICSVPSLYAVSMLTNSNYGGQNASQPYEQYGIHGGIYADKTEVFETVQKESLRTPLHRVYRGKHL